ncbi:MAG: alanine--tRNA ligase [Magnetococcales bacterium]|nr:alanine--tRNA ligase [Magnetococcales bacterium]
MTGNDIRKRFLAFFARHGHAIVPSSGLIPRNDPTLLFTNAGMVQFKSVFLGEEKRENRRAVSVQKCVRAGGKHNDLENVGRTARHHVFFEMLGNFSFGDYFKEGAITLAWEFVTGELGLPVEHLLATVHADDHEAYRLWREVVGLPEEKVIRIGTSDNFWSMGPTGPCGPCSEIFYDFGPEIPGGPPGSPDQDGDRFIEIWNLVFMQYNRDEAGRMTPLPNPCIDTGAGLERIATILQGRHNNFDSDLFQPLIQAAARLTGVAYGSGENSDVSLRVIADHIRAICFLIAEGVLPSNEGRGYVLRRIMRRAMRHGRLLGLETPFLHRLVPVLTGLMGDDYPELAQQQRTLSMVIETEERRFATTLGSGLKLLGEALSHVAEGGQLDGETVFTLYDTYGFPVDLTADIARDRQISLDMAGFQERMNAQRKRARAAWAGSGDERVSALFHDWKERHGAGEFLGYTTESVQGTILALGRQGAELPHLDAGEEGFLLCNQTPFYGESGGQVGDRGLIRGENALFQVTDTKKPLPDLIVHYGKVVEGRFTADQAVSLEVDPTHRQAVRRHHSATHLMHHTLRRILGSHVKQAGSMVAADRLRFDFSHFQALTPEELAAVEEQVNAAIWSNATQETVVMTPDEAVATGAMALFGEKYGDEVRVVRLGESTELCGGTHVGATGEIGLFRIVSEGAVAAGVRRLQAVCGPQARQTLLEDNAALKRVASVLKSPLDGIDSSLERLLARVKELEKELEQLRAAATGDLAGSLAARVRSVGSLPFLAVTVENSDLKELRELMDRLKDQLVSGVILLGAVVEDKAVLLAGVTKDLTARVQAGEMMKRACLPVEGKGGGRPDLAQGGGPRADRLPEALSCVETWLRQLEGV